MWLEDCGDLWVCPHTFVERRDSFVVQIVEVYVFDHTTVSMILALACRVVRRRQNSMRATMLTKLQSVETTWRRKVGQ